ncbi:MAG: plasmid recombination protein [Eubacteriales bacterium]|nr:plasmid recombination protein [Eubacteriales bacterium]
MKRTISTMVGKGSLSHNRRTFYAENVDPSRTHLNIKYCDQDTEQVYHELFDDAVERYNAKQKRSDRMIKDYHEKIRTGKQEKLFHEVVVQIGNKDDCGSGTPEGDIAAEALDAYMKEFQKRNPTLHVFSAHLHMDEQTPHLHIDFVPYITGSKRGVDTRVSLKQALAALGFTGGTRTDTEWDQWVNSEKEQLAKVMERFGIEWLKLDTHEEHLSVLDFKKKMRAKEVAELDEQAAEKTLEIAALDQKKEQDLAEIEKIEAVLASVENQQVKIAEIEKIQPMRIPLTGKVTLAEEDYHTLAIAAKKLVTYTRKDRELQKQVDQLKNENRKKDSLIDKLKGIIDGLKKEITELKQRLSGKESLHDRLEQEKMKAENEDLKKENKILREKLALHGIPFGRKCEDRNI